MPDMGNSENLFSLSAKKNKTKQGNKNWHNLVAELEVNANHGCRNWPWTQHGTLGVQSLSEMKRPRAMFGRGKSILGRDTNLSLLSRCEWPETVYDRTEQLVHDTVFYFKKILHPFLNCISRCVQSKLVFIIGCTMHVVKLSNLLLHHVSIYSK